METKMNYRLLAMLCVLGLSGCGHLVSTSMNQEDNPEDAQARTLLRNKTPKLTLYAQGQTEFTCVRDRQGSYWQFSGIEATLFDRANQKVGSQKNASLVYKNIETQLQLIGLPDGQTPNEDLPRAVFELSVPIGASQMTLLERSEASGGKPMTTCTPGEIHRKQKVHFRAKYVFWR